MLWDDEKDGLLMREMTSCEIFQRWSTSPEGGAQFWQEIATNRIVKVFHKYLILFGMDLWQSWGNAMIKLIQGIQGIELAVKEKTEYKTIYDNTFLVQKSYNNREKNT